MPGREVGDVAGAREEIREKRQRGLVLHEDDQREDDGEIDEVRRLQAGHSAEVILPHRERRAAFEKMRGEGQREDEAADREEELHAERALVDQMPERHLDPAAAGLQGRVGLDENAEMEKEDGEDRDEAQPINLRQESAGRRDPRKGPREAFGNGWAGLHQDFSAKTNSEFSAAAATGAVI